ncbi:ATP-binding protein [Sulfurimonas sp.]|uniref:ATP-binding protein n=1 Tax=Sulfurimonas sp. TaxID=2022749 RepID=UPI00261DE3E4|nr:ATP-binding protein [Sulfurimonas sp.]MCW8896027.1 ATP-binding protein [Sulfurimonas sp.]MCW9067470.1 ATP-binding protein [Sulfurimonas sp.]
MRDKLGKYLGTIDTHKLKERTLYYNTLILAEEGAGKTNLACKIRNFVIDNGVPTLYMDFANSHEDEIELRYKDEHFNYIRFEESEEFDAAFGKLIKEKKHIYLAVDPNYFSNKRDAKSKLTQTIWQQELLDNYYHFFHDIENLNGFYSKFEDFLLYMLGFANQQKYGFTFLAQPHSTFENQQVKLLFSFLYLGKCSNLNYYNTGRLKSLQKNRFFHQYRTAYKTVVFSDIKSNFVDIDEYIFEE